MKEPEGDGKKHVFDDPANVKRLVRIFMASCAVLFLLDVVFFFHHKHLSFEHGEFAPEGWFGFYGIYGFVACVLLVLIAKQMRKVLMRDEDYYDR
jgi:hypothetical protein